MAVAAQDVVMSGDRTRTRPRETREESGTDIDGEQPDRPSVIGPETAGGREDTRTDAPGRLAGLRRRLSRVFAPRAFLVALFVAVAGLVAGTAVVPLPGAGLLGLFVGLFLVGLGAEHRRYLESALAGGVTFGAAALLQYVVIAALGGLGAPLAVVAGGLGAVVGAVGHYFGRDLRDGLTREL